MQLIFTLINNHYYFRDIKGDAETSLGNKNCQIIFIFSRVIGISDDLHSEVHIGIIES